MAAPSSDAWQTLRQLASTPPDFTQKNALTPARISSMCAHAAGWTLLYGMQRVDNRILQQLEMLSNHSAVNDGTLPQTLLNLSGGIDSSNAPLNTATSDVSALHTSCRQPYAGSDWPEHIVLPQSANIINVRLLEEAKQFLAELTHASPAYTDWIHVGIGGSELGVRALYDALKSNHTLPNRNLHIISGIEGHPLQEAVHRADLSRTMVAVHSKSGSSVETRHNEQILRQVFIDAGLRPEAHFISITTANSPLDQPSQYRKVFHWAPAVQGRYSSTSVSGALTLGFMLGWECFTDILHGASLMDAHAFTAAPLQNLPCLMALLSVWNRNFLNIPTIAMLPYVESLSTFVSHVQQVDMESNGKWAKQDSNLQNEATAPVIWGAPGMHSQHAFFQMLHQSATEVACEFIATRQSSLQPSAQHYDAQHKILGNMLAQSIALAKGDYANDTRNCLWGNRPSMILLANQMTPRTIGALLALYEHKVTFEGILWGLNSFDQPGVEYGKKLAQRIIHRLQTSTSSRSNTDNSSSTNNSTVKQQQATEPLDEATEALLKAAELI